MGGVVRKNKVRLCWRRDNMKSVVRGGRVVVLLRMFWREKRSTQLLVRLIRCSMVVDCWCGTWGRGIVGGKVIGFLKMVVGFWRIVVRLFRRSWVVGLWRRMRVVGLWRMVMGLWMMIVGLWMIVWWQVGGLWQLGYVMRLCWVCWSLMVFGGVRWTVVTFWQVYRAWCGLGRPMRVTVNWSWAVI